MKHDIKQCPAPDCSDCGKDHHSLICPEEKKEQKIEEDGKDESDDSEDEDFYGDRDVFKDDIRFHLKKDYVESERNLIGKILTAGSSWGIFVKRDAIIKDEERELEKSIIHHQKKKYSKRLRD